MTIEIVESPAQAITLQPKESFREFASRTYASSKVLARYGDGEPITLKPNLAYTLMLLGMDGRVLTPVEFFMLKPFLEEGIDKAAAAGAIPAGHVKLLATAFDIPTILELPISFADTKEGHEEALDVCLDGELHLLVSRRPVIVPEETEPEEE